MTNNGSQRQQGATESGPRLGRFPIGSAQSRAAARALLVARYAKDREEAGLKVIYQEGGSVREIRGLADALNAARMAHETGESSEFLSQSEPSQNYIRGGHEECLAERIRRARERVARMQTPDDTR